MAAKLRLVQFTSAGKQRVGVELSNRGKVVDITAIDSNIPTDMKTFMKNWDSNTAAATKYVSHRVVFDCVCM